MSRPRERAAERPPAPLQVKHEFVCVKPDGDVRIKSFIDKAFAWYLALMESTEDQSRYLYNLQSPDSERSPVPTVPEMNFGGMFVEANVKKKKRISRNGKVHRCSWGQCWRQ